MRPARKPRILYVTNALRGGGAERSLLEMLRYQDAGLFERHLCVLEPGAASSEHAAVLASMPIHTLGVVPGHRIVAARLLPLLARIRPDIVHARLLEPNLWARFGRVVGAHVINEERSLTVDRPRWANTVNRASRSLVSVMVANSRAVAAKVVREDGFAPRVVELIRGGVDTERFRPATSHTMFDFVSVIRLATVKGIWELVDAMALVHATHPAATLLVCGDGPERAAFADALEARGLAGVVTLMGQVDDVAAQLQRAHVFVLASREEGLPNAVMEAMSCGRPVIATEVGGSAELVIRDRTGLLVPPRDAAGLADAMRHYLEHRMLGDAHGRAARARAIAELDIRRVARDYEQLYRRLVSR